MNPSRVYVRVDLSAICQNVKNAMARVSKDVKVMAVIKTDAYGHGAVAVAHALDGIGVYSFAVATIDEAVELRNGGIRNPILILGYVFEGDLQTVLDYDITTTVFSAENARELSKIAVTSGKTANVHIKLDTGMGRIGFIPSDESANEIKEIFDMPGIHVDGIFSHLARADEADKTSAKAQAELFSGFVSELESRGMSFNTKHICNSAGIIEDFGFDNYYDMVRCGIMLYGLYPSEEVSKTNVELKPALSLVSHVAYVKEVGEGFTVSYGSTFVTDRPTKIATIPVGYGDGYPRLLSNRGRVLINGEFAKIIGRVCMDQFMVDVTGVENVSQGSEVVLIGRQGNNEISAEEIASLAGTINYEIVCGINKRVPRIYKY